MAGKRKKKEVLAKLEPNDLAALQTRAQAVNDAQADVARAQRIALLALEGYHAFQVSVQERYDLPTRFDVDLATGVVTPTED